MTTETKNKIFTELKENAGLLIAVIIIPLVLLFLYGCSSTVFSIISPTEKVNRAQLQLEVDTFIASAEQRFTELDEQDRIKALLLEHAFIIAETNSINPLALLTTFGSVLGLGAVADNVRKRKVIRAGLTTYVKNGKTSNQT